MRKKTAKMVELICAATGEKFMKYKKEYDRQVARGATRFFKNRQVASDFISNETRANAITKECPQCHKLFESTDRHDAPKCCSRHCAAIYGHVTLNLSPERSQERKDKLAVAGRKIWEEMRDGKRPMQCHYNGWTLATVDELTVKCQVCQKPFVHRHRGDKAKTCSKTCRRTLSSQSASANPNCGGETNYKRYRYKGILMDSQWEVDVATWLDEHEVSWVRDRKMIFRWTDPAGKSRRYHPDFYLPKFDLYLDPKNKYLIEKDRFKIETVIKTHGIRIIWGLLDDVLKQLESLCQ